MQPTMDACLEWHGGHAKVVKSEGATTTVDGAGVRRQEDKRWESHLPTYLRTEFIHQQNELLA